MKNSIGLPLVIAGLMAGPVLAQGAGRDVKILRMSGPQLGVRILEVDKEVVARLKLKEERGALVEEVLSDSAAEKAGIRKDDVIVRFQGESVLTAAQLTRLVRDVPSGRKVEIDLIRAGAPLKVSATLERAEWSGKGMEMPDLPHAFNFKLDEGGPGALGMMFAPSGRGRLGITYSDIEGQLAHYFKAPKDSAVLVNSVGEGSAAEKAGIKAGDLLIKLGGTAVAEGSDLQEAVRDLEPGKPAPLTVWREGRNVELSVTIDDAPRKTQAPPRRRPVS